MFYLLIITMVLNAFNCPCFITNSLHYYQALANRSRWKVRKCEVLNCLNKRHHNKPLKLI